MVARVCVKEDNVHISPKVRESGKLTAFGIGLGNNKMKKSQHARMPIGTLLDTLESKNYFENFEKRLLNLSIRPAVSTSFI